MSGRVGDRVSRSAGDRGNEVAGAAASGLRPLTPADVDAVVALEQVLFGRSAWSRAMVREELGGPGRWYVGADASAPEVGLAAYAGSWFDGQVAQVMTIGVVPSAQRQGWGTRLLETLIGHARGVGAEAVLLEVRVDNDPAIALYERFGFRTLGIRPRYYQPEDVDARTMHLPLR